MQVQEIYLSDILANAAMTIKLNDKEEKPVVDPRLLERNLEDEDFMYILDTQAS